MCEKKFLGDGKVGKDNVFEKNAPVRNYSVFLEPQNDENAIKLGKMVVKEMQNNFIADFEKNQQYCAVHGGNPDKMSHVSTFYKIDGKIYMTYYANELTEREDPNCHTPSQKKVYQAISNDPHILTNALAVQVGLGVSRINVILKELKEMGAITRIGSKKSGYWEVKK